MDSDRNYAVTTANRQSILQRIANGEYVTQISQQLGLERSAISAAFSEDPDYQAARELGMACQLEQSLVDIDSAGDDLNLARVREIKARRLEWKAEREFGHRWGAKQTITHVNADLGDRLARARARIIDVTPTAVQQDAQEIGKDSQVIDCKESAI